MQEKIEKLDIRGDEILVVSVRNFNDRRRMLMLLPQLQAVQRKHPGLRILLHDDHTAIRFGIQQEWDDAGGKKDDVPPSSP